MERTYTLLADNTEKDLRRAMRTGKTFSCNNSPTCQAKIKDIVLPLRCQDTLPGMQFTFNI
jgi:hypothetical protein